MVKTVLVMEARKTDSGTNVTIPINSAITFALLPEGTDEVRLGASWEGTFTVTEMITLTLLPPVSELNNGCYLYIVCTCNIRHTHLHVNTCTHTNTHAHLRTNIKTHIHTGNILYRTHTIIMHIK